jgi:hypothetical protein
MSDEKIREIAKKAGLTPEQVRRAFEVWNDCLEEKGCDHKTAFEQVRKFEKMAEASEMSIDEFARSYRKHS